MSNKMKAIPAAISSRGWRARLSESQPTRPQKVRSPATAASPITRTGARSAARPNERSVSQTVTTTSAVTATDAAARRALTGANLARRYARLVTEANYVSGDDYVIEFHEHRFGFNSSDFEQRVTAAAVKLGLVGDNELDEDETADLVELDWIDEPRSGLGRYLVRHWERVSLVGGESLVYWLKKLVFRGAWLDHRVKEGLLEVAWDDDVADFGYRDPNGERALLELAPVPSWHELQFRR